MEDVATQTVCHQWEQKQVRKIQIVDPKKTDIILKSIEKRYYALMLRPVMESIVSPNNSLKLG